MTVKLAHWDFVRPVGTTRVLVDVGVEQGMAVDRCLGGSGIPFDLLDKLDAAVAATQELCIIRNLMRLLGPDFPLGIEIGRRYHATAYGVWGFALMSSATFGEAVSVGLRYLQLTSTFCDIRPTVRGEDATLVIGDRDLPGDVRDVLVEITAAALITLQFDLDATNLPVKRLALKMEAPPYADRFRALFGVSPEFGAAENALSVDARCLNLKLPQRNALTRRQCEDECRRVLERRRRREGWAGRVRWRLAGDPARGPTMDVLAAEFGVSVRTLRRRLADEGTDYEAVVDEVRETLAEELLVTTTLTVAEVSERLGYSEPSAFARAFRRWKGVPPNEFRRSV
ncbi:MULTISPECIES: AraC family transcriptional regulator [Burkholderia]|uniref:AraC family transcriptional regulator n=1 Tax=Burkholderia savannae TaxID=1637837 RepID=A0ABR5THY7_9BURK|nr:MULTISPECIES: AraC family transcriptional regulator [Burkholderia]AOJ81251.1 AraC family transcriptional regulator [Burkholderia savannae]AOK47460.1 AraC family transcriptional regulator [Burkholderia sp. MSMB617WGS]KVK84993.1 AraC family transcriptional regulator [Burkholderia sp. MSMB1498]KWZ43469.1 AraC family transcriptional regulator [Burkholderia savannae]KWZ46490.1 AraC family transcriptional regulator [Burkholderia savannae]